MRNLDFLIVGAQKSGTTTLDACLREHPEICMAHKKELHFFDNEAHFQDTWVDYAPYHAAFAPQPGHKVLGESTPIYLYWREAPRRIRDYRPDIKLIAILRNPIERAYSGWNMERDRGREKMPFWEAITCEAERCREAEPLQHRYFSYVDRGRYAEQLSRLWQHFPRSQTLVLRTDDLLARPRATLDVICQFLGVGAHRISTERNEHSREYLGPMSKRERTYLSDVFESEIRALEKMLGWDCRDWLAA